MKIKATKNKIFTINSTLKNVDFTDTIVLDRPSKSFIWSNFYKYSLGKFESESDDRIDEILLKYKPETISKLRYLYHIKRIGGGLRFSHLGYAKLNFYQHIIISTSNRILPWLCKFKNILKLISILTAFATIIIGYKQLDISDKIQKIEIVNSNKLDK